MFQLKLPSFLDQTPHFQFWLPTFFQEWILNFCFQNPSENTDSDQLHFYYMYVDDQSLLKRTFLKKAFSWCGSILKMGHTFSSV